MIKFDVINQPWEFAEIYQKARKWYCPQAVVYFLPSSERKFTVIASKKVGKAVIRNRAKRRMRHVFYFLKEDLKSGIYLIIARSCIESSTFSDLQKNLKWSFKKMDAFK